MRKSYREFRSFEKNFIKKEKVDVRKNFRIVEALYKEAVALGAFSKRNKLEGLETKIKIARVVNSVSETTPKDKS